MFECWPEIHSGRRLCNEQPDSVCIFIIIIVFIWTAVLGKKDQDSETAALSVSESKAPSIKPMWQVIGVLLEYKLHCLGRLGGAVV